MQLPSLLVGVGGELFVCLLYDWFELGISDIHSIHSKGYWISLQER